MTLPELLDSKLVLPKIFCGSKDELIRKLADRVYAANGEFPFPQEDVLKIIYTREKIGGTLLPSGLAIPHARLKDFSGFLLALATPAEPIFDNGQQIRMMALMITSQTGAPWYLSTLAALTKISRKEEYFSRLCGAQDPENFIRILQEQNLELD